MPNLSPVYQYYRDNFENIIDYRDKNICTDNGNPSTALLNTSYNILANNENHKIYLNRCRAVSRIWNVNKTRISALYIRIVIMYINT